MNNLTKERIASKVLKTIDDEKLLNKQVAANLGFSPTYMSLLKKESDHDKVPAHVWDKFKLWVDQTGGTNLGGYKLVEKEIIEEAHEAAKPKEEPVIKVKPEALEKRNKELLGKENSVPESKETDTEKMTRIVENNFKKMQQNTEKYIDTAVAKAAEKLRKEIPAKGITSEVVVKTPQGKEITQKIILDIEVRVTPSK